MAAPQLARLIESLLGVITILVFIRVAVPEARPWRVILRTLGRLVGRGHRWLYLGACLSILAFNYLFLVFELDARCTNWVKSSNGGHDFTRLVYGLEGEAVAHVQAALNWLPLTWFLGYVYVVVFPCLVFVSIFVFDQLDDRRGLAMALLGYALNFLLVLPFYLVFPVRETFHFYTTDLGSDAVRMLLNDIHPAIIEGYRAMSGLDNCFPSFHTSLAVTLALVAWHAGRPRYGWLITFFAAANVFSTVYLGVHWVIDVAAGLVVGVAAYVLARRASLRWSAARP